ncbi:MarR family winged helix-turn-helix transcriptional regulator [Paenibacillus harenae]|uniref:MarR family winged helix-turn-helix transcriptional regulator n=1 Tax=Paenibacillus harenae TaxID=306543 RepID=UPI0003F8A730|nr:MarR family winged helix-turn-helix transcriptional regulator [Paenibacillus harenae]
MENNNLRAMFLVLARRFGFLSELCCENCCGQEISLVQSHILFEIKNQHNPSIQDVANALGADITTFSRQVKALAEKGLVKKTPHQDDNRVQILSLTPEGEAVNLGIDIQVNQNLYDVLSHLSDFERDSVIRSIGLLNDAMLKSKSCCTPLR